MTGTILAGVLAAFAVGAVAERQASAQGVNVNVNIGAPAVVVAPPPPVVIVPPRLPAPPPIVAVPATSVFYAPHATFNLFVYSGVYYSFHDGAWFHATTYNGPWVLVPVARVPRPVLAVPVAYYKIPHGHAKKHALVAPGHGKGHKSKGRDD